MRKESNSLYDELFIRLYSNLHNSLHADLPVLGFLLCVSLCVL